MDEPTRTSHFAQLLTYLCFGDYQRDIAHQIDKAQTELAHRVLTADPGEKLALVLDIDETSLNNEPQILGGSFRVPSSGGDDPCDVPANGCGYNTWEREAKSPAIQPTLQLFREAIASGVSVFFITGRFEENSAVNVVSMRDATEKNLEEAGYTGYKCLFLRPQDSATSNPDWDKCADLKRPGGFDTNRPATQKFKDAVRNAIVERGYKIILNVGDQVSDLTVTNDIGHMNDGPAETSILLPNPFY